MDLKRYLLCLKVPTLVLSSYHTLVIQDHQQISANMSTLLKTIIKKKKQPKRLSGFPRMVASSESSGMYI
jgi:hypothetical protein